MKFIPPNWCELKAGIEIGTKLDITVGVGVGKRLVNIEVCPTCRNSGLERSWCSTCNKTGLIKVEN